MPTTATVRGSRWITLRKILEHSGAKWRRYSGYGATVSHPRGSDHGLLVLRISEAKHGFARVRSLGPWQSPLEPGIELWSETADEARVEALLAEYLRTGGKA